MLHPWQGCYCEGEALSFTGFAKFASCTKFIEEDLRRVDSGLEELVDLGESALPGAQEKRRFASLQASPAKNICLSS